MKLNNLSAKKICRLISAGMVFSMLVITGIFGGIMQDTRIFIAGGTLTLCAFFWIFLLVLFFGKLNFSKSRNPISQPVCDFFVLLISI